MSETPELTYAALAATMELSRLRSTLLVGTALVAQFPTEEAWVELSTDPEYIESLNALAQVLDDIKNDTMVMGSLTPEAVAEASDKHYARAIESVLLLAERLGVPPEDLVNVLISL